MKRKGEDRIEYFLGENSVDIVENFGINIKEIKDSKNTLNKNLREGKEMKNNCL